MSIVTTNNKENKDNILLDGKLFQLKTWELNHEEVESAILRHIPKDTFELNVIINKLGEPKRVSILLIKDKNYVEK